MIELTDINGKIWWVNPTAVSAVTACNSFGADLGFQTIKTRTYIYVGALENVIQMAEEPEEVVRKLQSREPWSISTDTVATSSGGRIHQ